MGQITRKLKIFNFHQYSKRKGKKMKVAILCLVLALFVAIEAAAIEAENAEKRALGCADEETYMKESEPAAAYARMVVRKLRPCADCCYDGRSETAKALCCATFGGLC